MARSHRDFVCPIALLIFFSLIACAGNEKVHIISRDVWGSQPVTDGATRHILKYITIHHGGVYVSENEDPYTYLRNLQAWSRTEKKWTDIPYHYLIDLNGLVYEGRPVEYPGDTNTDYDPTGHLLISVIGNYEVQEFTGEQYNALVKMLAYFCERFKIKPSLIKGHRDYTETACPGKNIYIHLEDGSLISDVSMLLQVHEKK